ncbi:MAG: hypothetical protein ACTHM6_03425 [Tepidisphaeraceae bacterium]
MKRSLLLLSIFATLCGLTLVSGGCGSNKLETGYAYTPLGDSSAKRRSYYADPFSPEARVAESEHQSEVNSRHPMPGQ